MFLGEPVIFSLRVLNGLLTHGFSELISLVMTFVLLFL